METLSWLVGLVCLLPLALGYVAVWVAVDWLSRQSRGVADWLNTRW